MIGAPRSGTTFLAGALGAQPGLVDLGEVKPLKAAIPTLSKEPLPEAAKRFRRTLDVVRVLGLAGHLRGVEQTPETSFVIQAALAAYPKARAVHIVRDGRDVVCSLLERGWLASERTGGDDAGLAYGAHVRFWVEPERAEEFRAASEARRAAWAWRRYVTAARTAQERTHELRYEELVKNPESVAETLAALPGPEARAPGRVVLEGLRPIGRTLATRAVPRADRRRRGRSGRSTARARLPLIDDPPAARPCRAAH